MKPNEVRLYNWLYHNKEVVKVIGLTPVTIIITRATQPVYCKSSNLLPIPIIDGRLTAKRFKLIEPFHYRKDCHLHYLDLEYDHMINAWFPIWSNIGAFDNKPKNPVTLLAIKYWHELQNLYYVLTFEEL